MQNCKNLVAGFLALLVTFAGAAVQAAGLHDYPNVAVLPFANKAILSSELNFQDANLISEFMIEDLMDSGRFNVMEREQLMAITQEHSLNVSGLVDPATAVGLGKLAGVQYLVYGSVVGVTLKESGAGYENSALGGIGGNKHTVEANVTVRIIDIETGRVMLAARGKGVSSSTNIEFKLNVTKNTPYETTQYDPLTDEEYIAEDESTSITSHKFTIGTEQVSQVQVHNAISKAVYDSVNGKGGILAKMDGKAKRILK